VNCDSRELELMPGSVAASSVVVYDIIGTYIRPLTGKQVVYWSHILIGKFDATRFGSAGLSPWEGRHVQCLSMLLIPCPIDAGYITGSQLAHAGSPAGHVPLLAVDSGFTGLTCRTPM
jgi:Na+/proline symporter